MLYSSPPSLPLHITNGQWATRFNKVTSICSLKCENIPTPSHHLQTATLESIPIPYSKLWSPCTFAKQQPSQPTPQSPRHQNWYLLLLAQLILENMQEIRTKWYQPHTLTLDPLLPVSSPRFMNYGKLPNLMKSKFLIWGSFCDLSTKVRLLGDWVTKTEEPTIYLNKWTWINFTYPTIHTKTTRAIRVLNLTFKKDWEAAHVKI